MVGKQHRALFWEILCTDSEKNVAKVGVPAHCPDVYIAETHFLSSLQVCFQSTLHWESPGMMRLYIFHLGSYTEIGGQQAKQVLVILVFLVKIPLSLLPFRSESFPKQETIKKNDLKLFPHFLIQSQRLYINKLQQCKCLKKQYFFKKMFKKQLKNIQNKKQVTPVGRQTTFAMINCTLDVVGH